jgi:DNA topoisomerase IB
LGFVCIIENKDTRKWGRQDNKVEYREAYTKPRNRAFRTLRGKQISCSPPSITHILVCVHVHTHTKPVAYVLGLSTVWWNNIVKDHMETEVQVGG